jgi:hypothetical protein
LMSHHGDAPSTGVTTKSLAIDSGRFAASFPCIFSRTEKRPTLSQVFENAAGTVSRTQTLTSRLMGPVNCCALPDAAGLLQGSGAPWVRGAHREPQPLNPTSRILYWRLPSTRASAPRDLRQHSWISVGSALDQRWMAKAWRWEGRLCSIETRQWHLPRCRCEERATASNSTCGCSFQRCISLFDVTCVHRSPLFHSRFTSHDSSSHCCYASLYSQAPYRPSKLALG